MSQPQYLEAPWTDLITPLLSSNAGGTNPPSLVLYRAGVGSFGVVAYSFNFNSTEKELNFTIQMPHSYKIGSTLKPHLHLGINTATAITGTTKWGLEYTYANIGGVFGPTTVLSGTLALTSPTDQYYHKILSFGDIVIPTLGISAVFICRLFRYTPLGGDTYSGDVFAFECDFHYQEDTAGSRQEYIK
jgi:hypothetical protein